MAVPVGPAVGRRVDMVRLGRGAAAAAAPVLAMDLVAKRCLGSNSDGKSLKEN